MKRYLYLIYICIFAIINACNDDAKIYKMENSNTVISFQVTNGNDVYNAFIDNKNDSIILNVPYGTDINNLNFSVTVSEYSTISPAPESIDDWTKNDIKFTVTSVWNEKKVYSFKLTYGNSGSDDSQYYENHLLAFNILSENNIYPSFIDSSEDSVFLHMPKSVKLNEIEISAKTSPRARISPDISKIKDWNNKIELFVISHDNKSRRYAVTLYNDNDDIHAGPTGNSMLSFILSDEKNNYPLFIDTETNSIYGNLPYYCDISNLTASAIISDGAEISPNPSVIKNWSKEQTFTVTSANNLERIYNVNVGKNGQLIEGSQNLMTSFTATDGKDIFPLFIDNNDNTVKATLPYNADLSMLKVAVTISEGAAISPDPEIINDWTTAKDFTVTSNDNKSRTYRVSMSKSEAIYENYIIAFNVNSNGVTYPLFVDNKTNEITGKLPFTIDLDNLKASVAISERATISPKPEEITNWSNPQQLIVTSYEGIGNTYNVSLSKSEEGDIEEEYYENYITSFNIEHDGVVYPLIINNDNNTVSGKVPYGVDLTNLNFGISISERASISPKPEDVGNWSIPVVLKVTSANNSYREYTVTITKGDEDDENYITSFNIIHNGNVFPMFIDNENNTIKGTVPYEVELDNIQASVSISKNATLNPKPEDITDWSNPTEITVTSANGTPRTYEVTITNSIEDDENYITSFNVKFKNVVYPLFIDNTNNTVSGDLPNIVDLTQLTASVAISKGASVSPDPETINDWSSETHITVSSANRTDRVYTINITANEDSYENILNNKITSFVVSNGSINHHAYIDKENHIIYGNLPADFNASNLLANVSVSEGAVINPTPESITDWSKEITLEVTSFKGAKREYTVRLYEQYAHNNILSFTLNDEIANLSVDLDITNTNITGVLLENMDINNLKAVFTISKGASIHPNPEDIKSWINDVVFTVTALNGVSKEFRVSVSPYSLTHQGDLTISSYAEAENFYTNGKTRITGNLIIDNSDNDDNFKNLDYLRKLKYVGGDIRIDDPKNLVNISGLNNIVHCKGIYISRSVNIRNIENCFSKIKEIETINISNNNNLDFFKNNFNNLENADDIIITDNNNLKEISGFEQLKILDQLNITNIPTLTKISNLENLEKCNSIYLTNIGNSNIPAFNNITFCSGISLEINCDNYSGFNKLEQGGYITIMGSVKTITGFNKLKMSVTLSLVDLENLGSLDAFMNLTFCMGLDIVNIGLTNIEQFCNLINTTGITIMNCDNLEIINCFSNTRVEDRIKISGNRKLTSIYGFNVLDTIPSTSSLDYSIIIEGNDVLTTIKGFNALKGVSKKINIYNNGQLKYLNFLDNLRSVDGNFIIERNSSLASISAIDKLTNIGGDLYISTNNALTTLNGLESLTSVNGGVNIQSNSSLYDFSGLKPLFDTNYDTSYIVSGNAFNPDKDDIINGMGVGTPP